MSNHYEILGISRSATDKEIKTAYRRKVMQWHPDRNGNSEQSKKMFGLISDAFEVLSDADKRRAYDQAKPFQGARSYTDTRRPPPRPNPYEAYDWQKQAGGRPTRNREGTYSSQSMEMYHAKVRLSRISDSFKYYGRRKHTFGFAADVASVQYNFPFFLLRHVFAGAAERAERRKAFDLVNRWHTMGQRDYELAQRISKLQNQFNEIERDKKGLRFDVATRVLGEMETELNLRHSIMNNCLNVIRGREKVLTHTLG